MAVGGGRSCVSPLERQPSFPLARPTQVSFEYSSMKNPPTRPTLVFKVRFSSCPDYSAMDNEMGSRLRIVP